MNDGALPIGISASEYKEKLCHQLVRSLVPSRLRLITATVSSSRRTWQEGDDLIFGVTVDASEVDETKAVDVELRAGEMVLFDIFTIHGARHNLGAQPRAGYTLRFMPSTSHYDHDAAVLRDKPGYGHDTRPLILVRGVDRCGKNDFKRGHPSASPAVAA